MKTTAIALCALLLAGCQSAPSKLAEIGGQNRIQAADVVQIAIGEPIPLDATDFGEIDTSDAWRRVFVGTYDPLFKITRTELRHTNQALGVVGRFTYIVEGELTENGETHKITASATRAFAVNMFAAMREAIELGIVATANECRLVMEQQSAEDQGVTADEAPDTT